MDKLEKALIAYLALVGLLAFALAFSCGCAVNPSVTCRQCGNRDTITAQTLWHEHLVERELKTLTQRLTRLETHTLHAKEAQ